MQSKSTPSSYLRHHKLFSPSRACTVVSRASVDSIVSDLGVKYRQRIFTPHVTILLFLAQVFQEDKSCIFAVASLLSSQLKKHTRRCSLNTGSYCKAKMRLPIALVEKLAKNFGQKLEREYGDQWKWKHGVVKVVDGTGFSLSDTLQNLKEFPRHHSSSMEFGFPTGRVVGVFSLATGSLLDLAISCWKGKGTGESSSLHSLWKCFNKGETLLGDSLYSSFWIVAMAQSKGIHVVAEFPKRSHKRISMRLKDQTILIEKPKKKTVVLSKKEFKELPSTIKVRIIKIKCSPAGFRPRIKFILTTHLSSNVHIYELANLYKRRWQVEINLKHLKTTMGMDILRGKSPDMIKKEIWVHMLAYNIIRAEMAKAGRIAKRLPSSISFHLTQQLICIQFMSEFVLQETNNGLLRSLAMIEVENRPDRYEPRVLKRRKKNFAFLSEPRKSAKRRLHKKYKGKAVS